jgi:hypothetical protein
MQALFAFLMQVLLKLICLTHDIRCVYDAEKGADGHIVLVETELTPMVILLACANESRELLI